MRTDYQNLNSFEVSAVVLAAAGVGLIATMMFTALPMKQQDQVVGALSMFDMHEQIATQIKYATNAFNAEQDFMNNFYVAFTQVATLPEGVIQVPQQVAWAYDSFLSYSDFVAADYQREYAPPARQLALVETGIVSGASVNSSITKVCNPAAPPSPETEAVIPYEFQPPDLSAWRQK